MAFIFYGCLSKGLALSKCLAYIWAMNHSTTPAMQLITATVYTSGGQVFKPTRPIATEVPANSTERMKDAALMLGGPADLIMDGDGFAIYGLEDAADWATFNSRATDAINCLAGDEFDGFFGPILIIETV